MSSSSLHVPMFCGRFLFSSREASHSFGGTVVASLSIFSDNAVICTAVQYAKYFLLLLRNSWQALPNALAECIVLYYAPFDTLLLGHAGKENTTNSKSTD